MSQNYEMLFELTVRSFLGDKAYHIAGQAHSENSRKEWFRKVLKKIVKKVHEIETSTKHKKQLMLWSEKSLKMLNERPYNESAFTMCLLRLIGALLGLTGVRPYNIATPAYFQTPQQYYTEVIAGGGDVLQDYYDTKNTISVRKQVVKQLKDERLTDFQISLVLNISEYQVKKLRKEL